MGAEIVAQSIELHAVRPDTADLRKIHRRSAAVGAPMAEISYIAKLYLAVRPPADNRGYELYIGGQQVRKYAQFEGGVYFKITDPGQLATYRGQKVRFRRPNAAEFIETEVSFPVVEVETAADLQRGVLPTAEDVLRR